MSYFGKIDEFDLANDDWLVYTERLEQYFIANNIDNKKQVALLLCVMGRKAYGVLHGLTAPEGPDNKPFAEIVRIMHNHLSSKRLLITKPIRYHERNQNEKKPITDHVAGLKRLSEHCQFGDGLDDALEAYFPSHPERPGGSKKSGGTHGHPESWTRLPEAGATQPSPPTSPVKLAPQTANDAIHHGSSFRSTMPGISELHIGGRGCNEAIPSSRRMTSPRPPSHTYRHPQTRPSSPGYAPWRNQPKDWQLYPRYSSMYEITKESDAIHRGSSSRSTMPGTSAFHSGGRGCNEAIPSSRPMTSPRPPNHTYRRPQTRSPSPSYAPWRKQPKGRQPYQRDSSMYEITKESDAIHRGSSSRSTMPGTSAFHSGGRGCNEAIPSSRPMTSPRPPNHTYRHPQTRSPSPSYAPRWKQPKGRQPYPRDRSMCGITNEGMQKNLLTETEPPFQCAEQIAVFKETEAKEGTVLQTRDKEVSTINKMEATVNSADISYQYGRGSHVPGECIFQNELSRKCNRKGHMERDCPGPASNEATTNTIGRTEAVKMDPRNLRDRTDKDGVREMRTEHLQKTMDTAKMDPDNFLDEIHEEEVQEIRSAIEKGDLARAVELINKTLECLENAQLNIAVTGEAGAGKSTFVNVLCGLNDEDEGAANTGVVETTMEPTAYSHPHYENVKYWDLPGKGTPNFKAEDYLQRVGFAKYDFFIIIASGRFRACNIQLAKAIHDMKKNFYFVRSKIDSDMSAAKTRRPKTYNEERILQEIREDCINGFMKEGITNPRVFLLDLLNCNYDCHLLQETLEKELPKHKRDAFLLSLPNISLPVLEKKREALRKQVWRKAILACAVAALPIPGLAIACDVTMLVKTMREYQLAFGLDKSSLCRLSTLSGKSMTDLKSEIKSPQSVSDINKKIVIKMLTHGCSYGSMFAKNILSQIPVFSLAAGGISYVTTSWMVGNFLNETCDDAGRVFLKAAETSV